MIAAPKIGAIVRATVRHANHYYLTAATQPFVDTVYEGTVIPNEKWEKPDTFCMTGDQYIRVRNVALRNVINIEYVKGAPTQETIRAFRVKSSDKKREYTVTVRGNKFDCNCVGFTYHHKCKHVDGVKRRIAA